MPDATAPSDPNLAPETPALFCFGLGYSAARLGRRLLSAGARVIGTTRDAAKAERLRAEGFEILLDEDVDGVATALREVRHALVSAGPDKDGDPTLRRHAAALAGATLDWLGYLSTTGVYGDHGGEWVDEDAPLTPSTARGRARVAAEAEWRSAAAGHGHPLHIFRLAGIYGPGRGPFAKLRAGAARRLIKPGQVFSRIHVDDIAGVVLASMATPDPGSTQEAAVYNLCDDDPAPPQDVIAYAAGLLGMPPPPEEDFEAAAASMTPMARSFYAESKRVSNARIKQALGYRLAHASYRGGLEAVLAEETAQAS